MSKKPVVYSSPNELEGRLPMKLAFPFGLQHVLAMFVGNLSPLLIIMAICGITADAGLGTLRVSLLQNAMLVAGINTMIQVRKLGPIGSGLPIVMGTSSGFIGVNKAIAASMMAGVAAGTITTNATAGIYAYGAIMGAQMCGGVFEMVLGFCIKPLRKFFPAVVTGTVVTAIGLSLFSVGIGFFGGGNSNADYGALWNLFLGLVTLIAILFFKHGTKGFTSVSAILLGIIVGYIASFIMGLIRDITEKPSEFFSDPTTLALAEALIADALEGNLCQQYVLYKDNGGEDYLYIEKQESKTDGKFNAYGWSICYTEQSVHTMAWIKENIK